MTHEIDKAAIFSDVLHRNAMRRRHGLPGLNVRGEYEFQVALTTARLAVPAEHADEISRIETEVVADFVAQRGKPFCYTPQGITLIIQESRERFYGEINRAIRV